jgi:uncharacterized protein YwqG
MRSFCCSSLGSLIFFPKEIILLFFFSLADVSWGKTSASLKKNSKMIFLGKNISEPKEEQQKDLIGENISEPKEEQQNKLFGETHQRA